MPESRKPWTYTNAGGAAVTEPVSIQGKEWAVAGGAVQKIDPNARVGEDPRTNGWVLENIPDAAEMNFSLGRLSTFCAEVEGRGFPAWSKYTAYTVPSIVWGSNGKSYIALQASGADPNEKDPVTEPLYWGVFSFSVSSAGQVLTVAGENPLPGTLICNGASYNVATYLDLHNVIGYKYGGSGAVFNVPNYTGYFLRGLEQVTAIDRGSKVIINGTTANGSPNITGVSSYDDLEIGMLIEETAPVGAFPAGTKIANLQVDGGGGTTPPSLTAVIADQNATVSGVVSITFTNRFDSGDGSVGQVIGTKQEANAGIHSHATKTFFKSVGTVGTPDNLNITVPLAETGETAYNIFPDGTLPLPAADTRPPNISVLYCIRY